MTVMTEERPVCGKCGRPVIEQDGGWMHAEIADAVFCSLVMGAKSND